VSLSEGGTRAEARDYILDPKDRSKSKIDPAVDHERAASRRGGDAAEIRGVFSHAPPTNIARLISRARQSRKEKGKEPQKAQKRKSPFFFCAFCAFCGFFPYPFN